ncbi:two-component system sensor histidine kinase NtrB [Methylobacterium soli]|uniref:histidine kinase n=1 Tax=Methylobacterium soli TaxID=553447 RepID=A0A6L3SUV5_9HYPH|nr:ATP-binding protein [Methylobacterium soli]KAB1074553.1 PAS domain S-box protein [Methylobacterium soli]GJE45263.1 Blue-light-activated protein [Methylobacterium soli]
MVQPEADGRYQAPADRAPPAIPGAWEPILAASPVATALTAPDGAILYANPAFLVLTGFAPEAVRGQEIRALLREGPGATGSAEEFLALTRDGIGFWACVSLAPIAGSDLSLCQVLDVTRRREAEGALALSRQREALGLLTNSVAHEFNNFLQILIGYVDGLTRRLGDRPEPFIQRALTRSTDAVERATILTRQLLAFSRRIAPDVCPVDLARLVRDVAERLRPGLPPSITLDLEIASDLPPALSNPTQVELALGHIVANACEAMPSGGALTIAAFRLPPGDRTIQRPGDGAVGILVRDTGSGMSPEMLARALSPFATSHEAGRGAGLAIVHGLMKRQNGTITLESQPGAGTSVRLIFPAVV